MIRPEQAEAEATAAALEGLACSLDREEIKEQALRYRELGTAAETTVRRTDTLTVQFDASLDLELLEQTVAAERACCPFFRFSFDPANRRLSVAVDSHERRAALSAIADALGVDRTAPKE